MVQLGSHLGRKKFLDRQGGSLRREKGTSLPTAWAVDLGQYD